MKSRREREAELVALMLFDLPHLRRECRRVISEEGHWVPIAALSGQELIRCILEFEFPSQADPQMDHSTEFRRRPR